MTNLMIRCDADLGERFGSGHAMRCFALAQAIKKVGGNPIFAMAHTNEFISMLLHDNDMLCILINGDNDLMQTIGTARAFRATQVVVDSYELDEDYLGDLANYVDNVVTIEDSAAPMFRQDVWDLYEAEFVVRDKIERVFVRVEDDFAPQVHKILDDLELERVDPGGAEILENMQECDIAISAGGVTAWELAIVGVPSLLVTDAPQQTANCVKLNLAGAALNLGWTKDMPDSRIINNISTLHSQSKRREMSFAAKRAITKNGTTYYLEKLGLW